MLLQYIHGVLLTSFTEVSVTVIHDMNATANAERGDEVPLLTIGEVAQAVDMTVRNLREWKTLGLLPPAEIRGRAGYYDPSVVDRIQRIQRLHEEGFPLELIRRMLDASGESADEVMRFARALRAPFRDDQPPVVDLDEWAAMWGSKRPADLRRARELGLIRNRADGTLEYTSTRMAEIGAELNKLGLTLSETLDATAAIRAHADGLAELFESVWMKHVWQTYLDAGMPESELPRLQETLATVQPLAVDAVLALFTVAMESRIEQGISREIERAASGRPKPGGAKTRRQPIPATAKTSRRRASPE
jgi:DNA-binding transcriptional MerR regulator